MQKMKVFLSAVLFIVEGRMFMLLIPADVWPNLTSDWSEKKKKKKC